MKQLLLISYVHPGRKTKSPTRSQLLKEKERDAGRTGRRHRLYNIWGRNYMEQQAS